jgi:hypothetical protein
MRGGVGAVCGQLCPLFGATPAAPVELHLALHASPGVHTWAHASAHMSLLPCVMLRGVVT